MHLDDPTWLDIDALHRGLRAGDFTALHITQAALDRIGQLDGRLAAYASVWPERALAKATRLDEERALNGSLGPLHGVPIALKDLCDVAGEPTRAGTTALGSSPAAENAEVVDRLEAAGAVILGKVKMTEGAFVEHHASVRPPVNPWNQERWTGISSSGSGVAVAAGLCTAALGTDTGGSIRYPSAACGLSGLKPTHGRVSLRGVYPLADSLDHIGPMARSATDAARIFSVLCGYDPRDPWSLAANPPADLAASITPRIRGLRLGYDARYCEEGVDPIIQRALRAARELFAELGAEIVEFEMPSFEEAIGAWAFLGSAEIANAHANTYPSSKAQYGESLAATIEAGRSVSGQKVAHAWKTRIAFSRRLAGCFEDGGESCRAASAGGLDALIAPVIPGLFPADTNLSDVVRYPGAAVSFRFTTPFNLSGSPSLTLPCGFDPEGAPVGMQLVGAHASETKLLSMGSAFQSATDYHRQRPPLVSSS